MAVLLLLLICSVRGSGEFSPFQTSEADGNAILMAYARWHNQTLFSDIPCDQKQAIVYHSRAGIGDSISGLIGRFASALQMGRLFLLGDLGTVHWSAGISNPLFDWDYSKAVAQGLICGVQDQGYYGLVTHGLTLKTLPSVIIAYGHPTEASSLTQFYQSLLPPFFQWERLVRQLVRPSIQVLDLLAPVRAQIQSYARVMALVIRTGESEKTKFLQPGDELRFVFCAVKWFRQNGERATDVIYLSSDSASVKQLVRSKLESLGMRVLSLPGGGVHTAGAQATKDSTAMSFADFFMLEDVHVLFRTRGSLFAATAAELFGRPGLSWYEIPSSACGRDCPSPKYPSFCDDEPILWDREL